MHTTRPFRGVAVGALTAIAATLALAGPMAGSAMAAQKQKTPVPAVTANANVLDASATWINGTRRTNSQSMRFTWAAASVSGTTLTCSLDGGKAVTGCTSPSPTYQNLASGTHTFVLKGKAPGYRPGNQTFTWTVDTTPPAQPSVSAVVPQTTGNDSVTVTWTDLDGSVSSYLCGLTKDGATVVAPSACDNPAVSPPSTSHTFTGLSDDGVSGRATYVASVWAVDDLGNPRQLSSVTPGSTTFYVDRTGPHSPIFGVVPNNPSNSQTAPFTWTDSDYPSGSVTAFHCFLDGVAETTSCSAGATSLSVGDGTHTFTVQGVDASNNVGLPSSYTWTVMTTPPPAPVITNGPASTTDELDATFFFGDAQPGVTYVCALDSQLSSAFIPCTSPMPYGGLLDGQHFFYVKAKDAAGNLSVATPFSWTIDTSVTSPVVVSAPEFLTGPAGFTADTHPAFTWSDIDVTTDHDQCRLDTGSWATCASGDAFAVASPEGLHTLALRSVDGLGNTSPAVTWSWTLDTTAPTAPVFSTKPAVISNTGVAMFAFASDPGVRLTCSLDGAAASLCASPATFTGLADGAHSFAVTATDAAGNHSSNTYNWSIDTSAPAAPVITGPSPSVVNTDSTSFTWTEADSGTTITCSVDNVVLADCTSPVPTTVAQDGGHVFAVIAQNGSGHLSKSAVSWTVDTVNPVLSVTGVPTGVVATSSVTPTVSESDANPGAVSCSLSGPVPASGCGPYTGLTDGSYSMTVDGTDQAGNGATEVVKTWTVDNTAPVLSVSGVPSGLTNATSVSPTISQVDNNAVSNAIACSLSGPMSSSGCGPFGSLADGAYTFTVDTTDAAGNVATQVVKTWTVDSTAPVLSVAGLPSGTVSSTTASPTVSQSDAHPGTITCSLSGPAPASGCGPYNNLPDGSYTFTADTTDLAGNVATRAAGSWTVKRLVTAPVAGPVADTTAPTASLTAPTSLTGPANATFSETVHGLAANGASIVLTGTSTVVPTNVACLSGTTTVPCTGSFTALRLTPQAALTPGQHYTVQVAAGAVQDSAGNPSVANSSDFRGSLNEQETSSAARATWATVKATAAYGHSYVQQSLAGATATYTFKGTNVTWWTVTGTNQGKAAVYVDGVRKSIVNNYAAATHYKVARRYGKLANKTHTLRIVVRGVKGATAGTGTLVAVDAFSVGKTRTNTPALVTTWRSLANSRYSAGHAAVAQAKNDTFSFTFRGTGVSWLTQRGASQGKVAVYVDGVRKAIVDDYAAKTAFNVKRSVSGLSDTVHTLKLVVLGTHHRGATGTWVTVDRFQVT